MRNLGILTAVVFTLALMGCVSPHVITLQDGTEHQTANEPKYNSKTGFYEFKTPDNRRVKINKDEIRSIERTQ